MARMPSVEHSFQVSSCSAIHASPAGFKGRNSGHGPHWERQDIGGAGMMACCLQLGGNRCGPSCGVLQCFHLVGSVQRLLSIVQDSQ